MFHRMKNENETPVTGQENTQTATPQNSTQTTTENQKEPSTMNASNTPDTSTDTIQTSGQQNSSYAASRAPGAANYNAGGYTPGYSTPGTSAPQSVSSMEDQARRLVIGAGITMSGEIESCDYLLVEGTVEAALKGAKMLEISETGTFYGTVEIDEATISGRFEGDLTVNGRLTILESGSITGSIAYRELAIEAGATLDGKVTPLKAKAAGGEIKKPGKSDKADAALAKAKEIKEQQKGTDKPASNNDDGQLFSDKNAAAA